MIDQGTQVRLAREYASCRSLYEDLAGTLQVLIQTLLQDAGHAIHSVTSRCKTVDSLSRKVALPAKSYASLSDITDLTGLRVTTYFPNDVDAVAAIVEREFAIDLLRSVDKRQSPDPDRFGYQSLHFVATLHAARSTLPEYRRFSGLSFEIQIRSILQHAWAEIEHDLGYKSAQGVPREIRRRFARVAGLLELADAEFTGIRLDLAEYASRIQMELVDAQASIELNLISLRALYEASSATRRLDAIVGKQAAASIVGQASDVGESLLPWLSRLSIRSVKDLEAIATKEHRELEHFALYWLEGERFQELPIGIGLFYLVFLLMWRTRDSTLVLEYCQQSSFDDPPGTAKQVLAYQPRSAP